MERVSEQIKRLEGEVAALASDNKRLSGRVHDLVLERDSLVKADGVVRYELRIMMFDDAHDGYTTELFNSANDSNAIKYAEQRVDFSAMPDSDHFAGAVLLRESDCLVVVARWDNNGKALQPRYDRAPNNIEGVYGNSPIGS